MFSPKNLFARCDLLFLDALNSTHSLKLTRGGQTNTVMTIGVFSIVILNIASYYMHCQITYFYCPVAYRVWHSIHYNKAGEILRLFLAWPNPLKWSDFSGWNDMDNNLCELLCELLNCPECQDLLKAKSTKFHIQVKPKQQLQLSFAQAALSKSL